MGSTSTSVKPVKRGANLKALNPNQRAFVNHLVATEKFDPTEAARLAGYKNPGQSAHDLLKNETVKKAIGAAIFKRLQRLELKADDVLRHLTNALFLDPIDLFEVVEGAQDTFRVRSLKDIPPEVRRCISKLKGKSRTTEGRDGEITTETFVEIEVMSKDAALALAMKHLGLVDGSFGLNLNVDRNLLVHLLSKVEEGPSKVIDAKFIEQRVTHEGNSDNGVHGTPPNSMLNDAESAGS